MHLTDAASAAPGALPLQAWSADIFAARDRHPRGPVLAPVLARGAITFITGARSVGKSWLALAMAHAAASGRDVLGWEASSACRAVYLDLCSGQDMLHARLDAIAGKRPSPRLALVPGDAQDRGLTDIATEAGLAALDALAVDADLVVLDGLSALIAPGRGVGTRWAALAAWLRSLRRRGLSVLLVDASEPRAIAALADTVLRLERPVDWTEEEGARFTVRLAASRGLTGKTCRRFEARLALRSGRAAWTRIEAQDDRAILAWRMHEEGYTSREIATALEVSPAHGWRLVERGEAIDPAIRDNAEIRDVAKEKRAREAAARRRAEKKAREAELMKAAWAKALGPVPEHLKVPRPAASGTARQALALRQALDEGFGTQRTDGEGGAATKPDGAPQTANPDEARKQTPAPPPPPAYHPPPLTRAQLQWRTPLKDLLRNIPP